jgi:uncharacterized protein
MYWHLILTEKCNSQCRYCYEKSMKEFDNGLSEKFEFEFESPCDSQIDILKLKKFLEKDPNPVIIFYGGEPLLKIEKIKEVMNSINARFCMQTNGKLLNNLPTEYLKRFSRILVSIDGTRERTDYNRGRGTYSKLVENLNLIRKKGYLGELVARMTISPEFPDIFEQVQHLISLKIFDSFHWQIDAGFYKNDFSKKKFSDFVEIYNKQISELVNWWISKIKKGKVIKIYPFLGILHRILKWDRETRIMCGAGHSGYAITTDGKIAACPIMNNIKNFYCGDLKSKLSEIKEIGIIEPCKSCPYSTLCGGRCLYSNHAKLWPKEGEELVCKTIIHLIEELKRVEPKIRELINKKIISKKDFEYEKYFGPEIIP